MATAGTFSISWNTTTALDGAHYLTAVARDSAGNLTESARVNITVDNVAAPVAPTITSANNVTFTKGTGASFQVTASGSETITYGKTGTLPNGVGFSGSGATAGLMSFTGTSNSAPGAFPITITATNGTAPDATQAFTITLAGGTDTVAPVVSIDAPTNNATISGSYTIRATATDNVAVVGVQFRLGSANLNAEVLKGGTGFIAPSTYQTVWNTKQYANGVKSLRAIARDAAGNSTTSSIVSVTVQNANRKTAAGNTVIGGSE